MDIPKSTYIYTNVNYTLEQILAFYNAKRIDTDLDCQRGYVWQESQKQQLIDTLINRERIPEFHVIKEADEAIFHFADGKQRITTIIKFLTDELKWNKADANPIYHILFDKKNKLKFSELPENFQNMILNTQISFALYSNMNPALVTKLFRKLNNGTALTEFQKGLAENITVKKCFLDGLMKHPAIDKIFSFDQIEKGEAEQAIIRAMILMKKYDNEETIKCDLRPPELKKYYVNLENAEKEEYDSWISELQSYQDKIKKYLDWLNVDDSIDSLKIKATYVFTFGIFFAYSENLSHETLKVLWEELRNTTASTIIGAGADYSASKVERYLNYIQKLI